MARKILLSIFVIITLISSMTMGFMGTWDDLLPDPIQDDGDTSLDDFNDDEDGVDPEDFNDEGGDTSLDDFNEYFLSDNEIRKQSIYRKLIELNNDLYMLLKNNRLSLPVKNHPTYKHNKSELAAMAVLANRHRIVNRKVSDFKIKYDRIP